MGKTITLIALLLLMLGGILWQSIYIRQATDRLLDSLNQVKHPLMEDNAEKAAKAADAFCQLWEKEKNTYEALFEHNEVDLISTKAGSIKAFCAKGRVPDALALVEELLFQIQHIHAINTVAWENIF
jgi:hypothetical protein